jgi:xylan 1,4-beta-xylosidase
MSSYLNGNANMFNVFSTIDFLQTIKLKPILELSFMPESLAVDPSLTVFHYKGIATLPRSFSDLQAFIQEFVSHLVDRYGQTETRSFLYEVWNEPNCAFLLTPPNPSKTCCKEICGNKSAYLDLYTAISQGVKAVDQGLKVGGPATAQTGWIQDFLDYQSSHPTLVDFVSTHLYPSDTFLGNSSDAFMDRIANVSAQVKAANLPLVITEFSAGLGFPVNDGPYSASAVFFYHLSSQAIADNLSTLSFWCFSDIFEEDGLISAPYTTTPKYGMQTIYGVPKSSYRMFEWISQQRKGDAIPVTSSLPSTSRVNGLTVDTVSIMSTAYTLNGVTFVQSIVTNFKFYDQPIQTQSVNLTYINIPNGVSLTTTATLELIDSTHAYAKPVWEAFGSPIYPNATEINAEMEASKVVPVEIPLTLVNPTTAYVQISLEAYGSARVTFSYTN